MRPFDDYGEPQDPRFLLLGYTLVSLATAGVFTYIEFESVFLDPEHYEQGISWLIMCLALGPFLFGGNLYTLITTHAFKRWDTLPLHTQIIALLTMLTGAVAMVLVLCALMMATDYH